MIIVSVLYPKSASSHFDHEYYTRKHISLVQSSWGGLGLERIELMQGMAALDGSPPAYELIGTLTFLSPAHLQMQSGKVPQCLPTSRTSPTSSRSFRRTRS
ncbi:EthD family reductase [Granulicella arctica]|uniref:EthD family reductase n=1 Tax=Granulicella arctica TaxID=940613 RepID=UPI0037C01BA4